MISGDEDLNSYQAPFKEVVLAHIREKLGAEEWLRLRSMAADQKRHVINDPSVTLDAPPEMLIDRALSVDGISVKEALVPAFKPVQIGQIEGQPVYYVQNEGIYLWGKRPDSPLILMVWITHPAYPPGW